MVPTQIESELDQETLRSVSQVLHQESRHYVAPFWWGTNPFDANSVCANGSCFFVEIGDTRFGVTAFHVIADYRRCLEAHPSTRLVVRNVDLTDWEERFIDGNEECDVATFRVTDAEFRAIDIRPLRCEASMWPPPPPMVGRGVFFARYPEVNRWVLRRDSVEFLQQSNGLVAANVETDEIEVVVDPAHLRSSYGHPPTPTTKNLSGYSGAPLLVVSAALGPPFWLGGVIIRQMKAQTEDRPTHIWARRPGCVLPNGSVRKPRYVL